MRPAIAIAVIVSTGPALAQEAKATPARLFIAPKVAMEIPVTCLAAAPSASLEATWATPVFQGRLLAGVEVSLASLGAGSRAVASPAQIADGGVGFRVSLIELAIAPEAQFRLAMGPPGLSVHGFAGPLVALVWVVVTAGESAFRQFALAAGFTGAAGAGYHLGPGDVVAEVRFRHVGLSTDLTGAVNAAGISLAAGYRFGF